MLTGSPPTDSCHSPPAFHVLKGVLSGSSEGSCTELLCLHPQWRVALAHMCAVHCPHLPRPVAMAHVTLKTQ